MGVWWQQTMTEMRRVGKGPMRRTWARTSIIAFSFGWGTACGWESLSSAGRRGLAGRPAWTAGLNVLGLRGVVAKGPSTRTGLYGAQRGQCRTPLAFGEHWATATQGALRDPGLCCETPSAYVYLKRPRRMGMRNAFGAFGTPIAELSRLHAALCYAEA